MFSLWEAVREQDAQTRMIKVKSVQRKLKKNQSLTFAGFIGDADPLVLCFEGVKGGDGEGKAPATIADSSEKKENSPISSAALLASMLLVQFFNVTVWSILY